MGQSRPQRRTALIVEDDAELRELTAALLEESELDTIECESAEAALATMLLRGQDVTMIFADIRLPGVMDGVDLAREVKMRWPHLTVVLTSGNPGERLNQLPPGVQYMPKPWQPLNVLMVAERARLSARGETSSGRSERLKPVRARPLDRLCGWVEPTRKAPPMLRGASSDNGAPPLPLPPLSRRAGSRGPGRAVAGRRGGGWRGSGRL